METTDSTAHLRSQPSSGLSHFFGKMSPACSASSGRRFIARSANIFRMVDAETGLSCSTLKSVSSQMPVPDRRQSGTDPRKFHSRREIGIPMALWELCGKRLCLGFVVELLNCGTLCTEVDEEFRESFGGEPLQ